MLVKAGQAPPALGHSSRGTISGSRLSPAQTRQQCAPGHETVTPVQPLPSRPPAPSTDPTATLLHAPHLLTPHRTAHWSCCMFSVSFNATRFSFFRRSEFTILTSPRHKTTRPCLQLRTTLFSVHFSPRGRVSPRVTMGSRGLSQP